MSTIRDQLGFSSQQGEVGIEIEVEGHNLYKRDNVSPYWKYEYDGSLRGEDNAEYVLKSPISRDSVTEALGELQRKLENHGSVIDETSERTSVHVHLNFLECTYEQLLIACMLYYSMEEELFNFVAPHRRGNFYCLRYSEATYPSRILRKIHNEGTVRIPVEHNNLRYGALNLASVWKYGSLEFRALEGTMDVAKIEAWVNQLLAIKDQAVEIGTIQQFKEMYNNDPLSVFPSRYSVSVNINNCLEPLMNMMFIASITEEVMEETIPVDPFAGIALNPTVTPIYDEAIQIASRIFNRNAYPLRREARISIKVGDEWT